MSKHLFNNKFIGSLVVEIDYLFESNTDIPKRKVKRKEFKKVN